MNVLRVTASMDPAMGGPPQGIRNSIAELERLGIRNEAVCCDPPDAAWLGKDSFPVHALGPGKYGFAYTPKLGLWLDENLPRFDAVIVHGLWLWPSVCATRAVARERARRREQKAGHRLTRMGEDKSERLAADRTGGNADCRMTSTAGGLSSEKSDLPESLNVAYGPSPAIRPTVQRSTLNSKQLRCFVMPHGMLDPWFQRDKSRRIKAVRNWFYWWLVERGVVNSADAMLFTCQQELELARTTFGGYRPKREINVGYGIAEPPAFEPKMQEAFATRCPGLNGRPYLLFMSRVHPKKNVAALVRAYARVARERAEAGGLRPEDGANPQPSAFSSQVSDIPDLVIAGPGWDSTYGEEVRTLIDEANKTARAEGGTGAQRRWPEANLRPEVGGGRAEVGDRRPEVGRTENCQLPTANSACVHAVDMLAGDAKWGALYGCEAFVLPSHQENFGIAVVESLACGKPVLISDQVNIWREIVEDSAGLAEEDTEEGVEKLLRRFLAKGGRHEAKGGRHEAKGGRHEAKGGRHEAKGGRHEAKGGRHEAKGMRHEAKGGRHEAEGIRQEAEGGPDGVQWSSCASTDYKVASPPQAERAEGGGRMEDGRWRMADGGGAPRECYLKRFAIGPAAARLNNVLKGD